MSEKQTPDEQTRPRYFGTDGIRDLAGQGRLSPENVTRVGGALARFARRGTDGDVRILLAHDPRPSGEATLRQLAAGMAAEGAEVFDAGVLPSPALAWLTAARGYALGCAISASHNPAPYNGIKPFLHDGRKLSESEELEVEAIMAGLPADLPPAPLETDVEGPAQYVAALVDALRDGGDLSGLELAVDLSAGAASATAPETLSQLGANVSLLHAAGSRAINEDCGTEHPEAWLAAVRASGADAGLAFDGDADRVLVADETGSLLDGDDLLAILAADLEAQGGVPARTVVGTVMANLGLHEFLTERGIALERTRVGDRNVAEAMRARGAVLGGEPAGHIVLARDDLGRGRSALIGDGVFAGVRVLQAARRSGRPLSELRRMRARRPQRLVNVQMAARRDLSDWPAFQAALAEQEAALGEGGRFVVRYSGTEPLLRVMAEGRDVQQVERAVEAVADVARAHEARGRDSA